MTNSTQSTTIVATPTVAIDEQYEFDTTTALVQYHRFDGERSSSFKNIDESGRTLILIPVNCEGQAYGSTMREIAQYYPDAYAVYKNKCQGRDRLAPGKLVFSSTPVRKEGKIVNVTDRRGKPVLNRHGEQVQEYRAGEVVLDAKGQRIQSPLIFCFIPVKLTASNRESACLEFAMQGLQRLVELQMQGYLQQIGITEVRAVKLVTDKNPRSENHWESFGPLLLDKLCMLDLPTTVYISADDREFYYDQSNNLVPVEAPQDHWTSNRLDAMM